MAVTLAVWIGATLLTLLSLLGIELVRSDRRVSYAPDKARVTRFTRKPNGAIRLAPREDGPPYVRVTYQTPLRIRGGDLSAVVVPHLVEARLPVAMLTSGALAEQVTGPAPTAIAQDRPLRVAFSRHRYIGQAFHVEVSIGAQGHAVTPLSPAKEIATTGTLRFVSREAEPQVQVELQFASGEFNANRTKAVKPLPLNEQTDFDFLVKPLKAEDCVLTVVISYVSPQTVPEHVVQRRQLEKDITDSAGTTRHEHGEETIIAPEATAAALVTPLWTSDLVVSVKQIFGMNASTLGAAQKIIGVLGAVAVVSVAIATGKTSGGSAVALVVLALVNAVGAPIYDGVKSLVTSKML